MKGIMFNTKYGLESAVLNGTKTRTWRADKQPRYKVGEIVAIKQRYKDVCDYCLMQGKVNYLNLINHTGWRNKMFVKNELMPHQIRITSVKKCRLQDLTDEECLREGIVKRIISFRYLDIAYIFRNSEFYETAKQAFSDLINKLNGKGYWETNPEGYAYEFELVK